MRANGLELFRQGDQLYQSLSKVDRRLSEVRFTATGNPDVIWKASWNAGYTRRHAGDRVNFSSHLGCTLGNLALTLRGKPATFGRQYRIGRTVDGTPEDAYITYMELEVGNPCDTGLGPLFEDPDVTTRIYSKQRSIYGLEQYDHRIHGTEPSDLADRFYQEAIGIDPSAITILRNVVTTAE